MSATPGAGPGRWRRLAGWLADNWVLYIVAAGAYGGSLSHWLALAEHYKQGGLTAWFIAACVDLLAFQAARERAHDAKTGRERRSRVTFPAVVLAFSAMLTLLGNVWRAQHTPGGVLLALIPGVALLISLTFMERRAAEATRRARASQATAEAREAELAEERRLQAERDRQRQEAAEAERQRQADAGRKRHEREQRLAEAAAGRHGAPSPSASPDTGTVTAGHASVTGNVTSTVTKNVTGTVTPGLRVAPPPEARARSRERQLMWDHWVTVIRQEHRLPTGEELRAAGGCGPASAAGRIAARDWKQIEPARSLLAGEPAAAGQGGTQPGTQEAAL